MKKRVLATLLALLMLLALFSACSTKPEDTGSGNAVDTTDDKKDDVQTNDKTEDKTDDETPSGEPVEVEPLQLEYMGRESHQWTYTLEEAAQKGFETLAYYEQLLLDKHNLVVTVSSIDNEAYKTTLSGYLAANALPDTFISQSMMDDALLVNTMLAGRFADIDDIIACSPDGNFATLTADGEPMNYLKAWSTAPDGHWYMVKNTDNAAIGFDFDNSEIDYLVNFGMSNWYDVCIRRDWLDKLNLSMPTTTEEFKDALIAFQTNDINGNGASDERAFLGFGLNEGNGIGTVFSNGVAGWFGLHRDNFVMDTVNGAVMSAIEDPGYAQYANYAHELYENQVALIGEGMAYQHAVNAAGNYCSAHPQYPNSMMTVSTGDPDSEYEPMPIIQAIEGVKPHLLGQATVSSFRAISFSLDCDYNAAAEWLNWIFSKDLFMLWQYGIEGKAWEWKDDGTIYRYRVGEELTQEEEERYGDMWCYAPWCLFPQFNTAIYDVTAATYSSVDEALAAGEPYRGLMTTFEEWKSQNSIYNWHEISPQERLMNMMNEFGTDNMQFDITANFETLATEDEAAILNMYKSDLILYLNELTTSHITGQKSTDTLEEDIQYAYDNLGMQEYADVIQARIDRYLVVLGREPILG